MTDPAPQLSSLELVNALHGRVTAHGRALDLPPLSVWVRKHRITIERRVAELETRPWLRQLYDDAHPSIVLRKATQVGGSVWAILSMLQKCVEVKNWRGTVYFFPTKTDVTDFSQTRVGPLLEENPYLQTVVGDIDKTGVRQVGAGFVYFRGMRSKTGMKSVPADGIVFDELDEATDDAKAMAVERLAASPYRFCYELSNPSIPQFGIDYAYSGAPDSGIPGSDQRMWHIRCGTCNRWVSMESEFPTVLGETDLKVLRPRKKKYLTTWRRALTAGIDVESMDWYRCCPTCGTELDPQHGEWVASRPTVKSPHGYSLSQLYSPTVDPGKLVKLYHSTRQPHHFYNLNIGIAWIPSEDVLTPGHVLRFCGDYPNAYEDPGPCTMGVDQGNALHVVISRPGPMPFWRQIVHIGVYQDWEQLDLLMQRFSVRMAVVDRQPEQRNARSFALRHPKCVYLNTYNVHAVGRPKWNDIDLTVSENRTEIIDVSRMPFRVPLGAAPDPSPQTPVVTLPARCWEVEEFARHVAALVKKRVEEGTVPGSLHEMQLIKPVQFVYVASVPDHFAHAWVYDNIAWAFDASSESRPIRDATLLAVGNLRSNIKQLHMPTLLQNLSRRDKHMEGYETAEEDEKELK
jgi:hypothetical protein